MITEFFTSNAGYWTFIGLMYLLFMSYKDFSNNMKIDERHNFVMMGLTISLLSHFKNSLWYIITLVVVIFLFYLFFTKYTQTIGEIDVQSLSWIILGFGIINTFSLLIFFIMFVILTLVYACMKYVYYVVLMKKSFSTKSPFLIVIACAFLGTALIFGLF